MARSQQKSLCIMHMYYLWANCIILEIHYRPRHHRMGDIQDINFLSLPIPHFPSFLPFPPHPLQPFHSRPLSHFPVLSLFPPFLYLTYYLSILTFLPLLQPFYFPPPPVPLRMRRPRVLLISLPSVSNFPAAKDGTFSLGFDEGEIWKYELVRPSTTANVESKLWR